MIWRGRFACLYFIGISTFAQTQSQAPVPKPGVGQTPTFAGIENSWDVRDMVDRLVKDDEQLKQVLSQLNPQQWFVEKHAPAAYTVQQTTAIRQVTDVVTVTKFFGNKTDSMPMALDVYFRLEALEDSARTLSEGAQKYADAATAGKLSEAVAHNFNNRERFRDYINDLAKTQEQNFKLADEEAQRCRGMISKEAPPKQSRKKN